MRTCFHFSTLLSWFIAENYTEPRCVFPFTYYGIEFNSCTSMNDTKPWCSTTEDMKVGSGAYVYCQEQAFTETVVVATDTVESAAPGR